MCECVSARKKRHKEGKEECGRKQKKMEREREIEKKGERGRILEGKGVINSTVKMLTV